MLFNIDLDTDLQTPMQTSKCVKKRESILFCQVKR